MTVPAEAAIPAAAGIAQLSRGGAAGTFELR